MSGPASNPQWYLARDGEQFGPISEAEMAKLVELGHLKPTDLLWREGFPDWRPAMVVFPPHPPAHAPPRGPHLSRGPRLTQQGAPGRHSLGPEPGDRAGYIEEERARRPSMLRRVVSLLLVVVVLTAAAGAAYFYRERLAGLLVSLNTTSNTPAGPAIADRKSLELPPLAGFGAGSAEAIDAALQRTALWKVVKREFPDWYSERIAEAAQLAKELKDDAVIGQLVARKLAKLRREHAANGPSATAEKLKTVATAYNQTLARLRSHSPEACAGFIRRGEAEPLIVALLQGSDHTAHLQAFLTAVFEAIGEGRQLPRVHPRPTREQFQVLISELNKRGWTPDDLKLFYDDQMMAKAPPEKVCRLSHDFFAAQLAMPDQERQLRLLISSLQRVFFFPG